MSGRWLRRIVSLEPSVSAIISALGRADCLVGVSTWCDRFVDVGDRPRLGTTWCADADEIKALEPDLVVASVPYRAESVSELLKAGLDVLCLYPRHLGDVFAHIVTLGRLTDAAEEAERLVGSMQDSLEAIRSRTGALPRPRVYVEIWNDPLMSASPWVADLVGIAGGQCVPPRPGRHVSAQEVLTADPQIIIVAWAGIADPSLDEVMQRPGWDRLEAVRDGKVFVIDEMMINVPGPNLVCGAQLLLSCLHPGMVADSRPTQWPADSGL
jgi:iron complex transport system substrate-binding protein